MMITVLGPTATGKTKLAAAIAYHNDGEIISADSRQVYEGMDIGTGKDLQDYYYQDRNIPFHLIDIAKPGEEYNVYAFQHDFLKAYEQITSQLKLPILCGGSGMYLDAILKGYKLIEVPEDTGLRQELLAKSDDYLRDALMSLQPNQHNTTDLKDRKRLVRAIEIAKYYETHGHERHHFPDIKSVNFGILYSREELRRRITERLKARLNHGLVEEVQYLLGILTPDQLRFYGLEYRYVTDYLTGKLTYNEMVSGLNTAIHQFAKKQVTWFRRMEKKGTAIHWIEGTLSQREKLNAVEDIISKPRQ